MKISLALTLIALLSACGSKAPPSGADQGTQANPAAPSARTDPAFDKLTGRWERPDGGYILEITAIESGGKLQAAYFNPGPIHVSRAFAFKEGDTTKVFVELQDVNYPGCTYSLKYDAQFDQLYGEYFQAALQQTFDVAFARLK